MKVGDLLYFYAPEDSFRRDDMGIALATRISPYSGEAYMKTYWFGDKEFSEEPLPGNRNYNKDIVGVLSESR